jgi:acyl-CoA dehydrogenase
VLAQPSTDEQARGIARDLLAALAAEGLLASIVSRDLRALCLTREAIAGSSSLADALIAVQALVLTPLLVAGTDAQRAQWLESLASGRALGAFAMTEPGAGSDVAAIRTRATREGGTWVIDGEKHLISNAGIADVYLVFARTMVEGGTRGLSAFLVPADTVGLRFESAQVSMAPHPLGRLLMEGCRVPATAMVGEQDRGFQLGMTVLDWVRSSVGAAACGMAARALIESLLHATQREQFGEPLAAFQIIREKIGQMTTLLEAGRLLVYRAAWQRDSHHERNTLEAAMAKSFATEAAQQVIDDAVQIAGGTGVLLGHPVEHLYRAIRALRIYEGTTEIQQLLIAQEMLDVPGAPRRTGAAS